MGNSETNWPLLLSVVVVVFGGFGVFSVARVVAMRRLRKEGTRVMGKIVVQETFETGGPRSERQRMERTVVEYAANGRMYQIQPPVASSISTYQLGHSVPVYFAPDKPDQALIITGWEYAKWIMFIVACFGVVIGLSIVAVIENFGNS